MYQLLILFTNGDTKTIEYVNDYGYNHESELFHFIKNGRRSFFPKDNIKFFGVKFDWEEEEHES